MSHSLSEGTSLSLWALEKELVEAYQRIEELKEVNAPADEVALAFQILDTYLTESKEKRDKCGQFLEHLEGAEVLIEKEIDRLEKKRARVEGIRKGMNDYILAVMERNEVKKLEGKLFTFTAKQNPPSVEIIDELAIAPEYLVQPDPPPPRPDKNAIKEALKRGEDVQGAKLIQKKRLVID